MAKSSVKSELGQFAALPLRVAKTDKYSSLDGWGVKLLMDLLLQYNGRNNGDFTIAWSVLRERGWRSKGTVANAERALRRAGFIIQTRRGGSHVCSLYAVSWLKIDECIDRKTGLHKHEWRATLKPPGGWKDDESPVNPPPAKTETAFAMSTNAFAMRDDSPEDGTHGERKPSNQYASRTETP